MSQTHPAGCDLRSVGPELWSLLPCIWSGTRSPPCLSGCMMWHLCSLSRNCISSFTFHPNVLCTKQDQPGSVSCQIDWPSVSAEKVSAQSPLFLDPSYSQFIIHPHTRGLTPHTSANQENWQLQCVLGKLCPHPFAGIKGHYTPKTPKEKVLLSTKWSGAERGLLWG